MKLEDQVCNLKLSKKLKELGVKQESAIYWIWDIGEPRIIIGEPQLTSITKYCSAFTVAELGEGLPDEIEVKTKENKGIYYLELYKINKEFKVIYEKDNHNNTWTSLTFREKTEANARAKMRIYLIENGLVKI
jgi:hypothetical protein